MSAAKTPDPKPADLVLKAARKLIDKEMAALNAGDGVDAEESLRFREAFISFLEAQVREGMKPGDVIEAASLVAAFTQGLLVSASCPGCRNCVAEAVAEMAEMMFAGAGINASVETIPAPAAPTKPTKPTTKH